MGGTACTQDQKELFRWACSGLIHGLNVLSYGIQNEEAPHPQGHGLYASWGLGLEGFVAHLRRQVCWSP
jgi:hypothetical protein